MIIKQAMVPLDFTINSTIRSAVCCCQKLELYCTVGVVWEIADFIFLMFPGKSTTGMEMYILSDNNEITIHQ